MYKLSFLFLMFISLEKISYCLEAANLQDNTNLNSDNRVCKCPVGSEAIWGINTKTPEGQDYCGSCNYK